MSKTAFVHGGSIFELLTVPEGITLDECYSADYLARCTDVPTAAQIGWTLGADGKTWGPPPPPPSPLRSATVSALLDALSSSQRATITTDHMARLVARAQLGPVVLTDPKVKRAADDLSVTPDAWFTLAGA